MATQTPKDVLKFAKDNKVEAVDLKFLDFLGIWQHFTIPTSELDEALFEEGSGFDGSSIRGWQPINASDMLVMPDPTTAAIDPFMQLPTLSLICNIVDPISKEDYSRDPLRDEPAHELLRARCRRGPVEHRPQRRRLQQPPRHARRGEEPRLQAA